MSWIMALALFAYGCTMMALIPALGILALVAGTVGFLAFVLFILVLVTVPDLR